MWNSYVNKIVYGVLAVTLILGWMMGIAWHLNDGPQAETLWVASFFIVFTLSAIIMHQLLSRDLPRAPDSQPQAKKLIESGPGSIVGLVLSLILMFGTGGIIGTLTCVPINGIEETITLFPDIMGMAILGAALSVIGFFIFFVVVAFGGRVSLPGVYEAWITFQSPIIGGVVGAAIGCGYIPYEIDQALGIPAGMRGGLGVYIVVLGSLVGGLGITSKWLGASRMERQEVSKIGDCPFGRFFCRHVLWRYQQRYPGSALRNLDKLERHSCQCLACLSYPVGNDAASAAYYSN